MKLYMSLFLIGLTSCKTMLLNTMVKDPKVENTASIKAFQEANQFSTVNSLIMKGDKGSVENNLMMGFSGYKVFNTAGEPVCYNGSATCSGTQFMELMKNQKDSFQVCSGSFYDLNGVLSKTYNLKEEPVTKASFDSTDYYIIAYWTKFLGGKRGYEDAVAWLEEEIAKSPSGKRFTLIKVNADMQESWGLAAGEKAKLKFKRKGSDMSIDITNIPVRK